MKIYGGERRRYGIMKISRNAFEKRLPDYIIQKLKKTSRLCNPESNHAYEKRLPDYIIRKLITNLKNDFQIM